MYNISSGGSIIVKNLVYLPVCGSTNDEAMRMALHDGCGEGLVLVAGQQLAGKGQRGNVWEAEADKNLTFSVVLKPVFLFAAMQFGLNMAVSLAVMETAKEVLGRPVKVKWPNDIFCAGHKIGGILIENLLKQQLVSFSVVGIGLNVNQLAFNAPKAASLASLTGKMYDLGALLEDLLGRLEARYLQLRGGRAAGIRQVYLENMLWYQEKHAFIDLRPGHNGLAFEGEILGVDEKGRLCVDKAGRIAFFGFKEIVFVD